MKKTHKLIKCPECKGRGLIEIDKVLVCCYRCNGEGKIEVKPNLNTDAKRKEFYQKFTKKIEGESYFDAVNGPSPDEVWNFINPSLQQAYQKGREDERERIIKIHESYTVKADSNQYTATFSLKQFKQILEQLKTK